LTISHHDNLESAFRLLSGGSSGSSFQFKSFVEDVAGLQNGEGAVVANQELEEGPEA
jgi:hypothetical protein